MGITHMELICCKELAHVRNGSCTRHHVHMSLQFVLGIDMIQSSTLTNAIVWMHYSGAMLPFSLCWKIDYHGQILQKLEGSSLTPDWFERKVAPSQHKLGMRWTRVGNGREPHHGRRGGGRCNAGCVTKRGITEEHALSGTRYRRVVVSQTRYAKFELWHSSKCNLKQNAWYMPLDQNACYMPFNYVFLKLKKYWIKF